MRRRLRALFNWKILVGLAPALIGVVALAPAPAWVVVPIFLGVVSVLSILAAVFAGWGGVGPGLGAGSAGQEALRSRLAELQQDEVRRLRQR